MTNNDPLAPLRRKVQQAKEFAEAVPNNFLVRDVYDILAATLAECEREQEAAEEK
ncbi:MAG: hypothetical protein WC322_05500 [Candidatus Paceibacterota bacterium]|jgi:hypothetical protein